CGEFGVSFFDMHSPEQGIVHVIGPELGLTQPGMTIVCGDSHTSTHGAFGALAFGIGTSEVEHVLATQCLPQQKPKTMLVNVGGDRDARYDRVVEFDAGKLAPFVTWGTSPGMVAPVTEAVPNPERIASESDRAAISRALQYMGLKPGTRLEEIDIDRVFIGSCTNARIEDLRAAARVVKGYHTHPKVRAMVVPGSKMVKSAAEAEGLDRIFRSAGFEWREPGCS